MLNIRFIFKMLGAMFIIETPFMLLATAVAFFYQGDDVYPLALSSGILFVFGNLLYLVGYRANESTAGRREGMLIVALTWALFSFFGMLPFYLGGYIDNITDAYFETMSGFTTTGATILSDIESLPHGILFWRSLTQWQGGIGVIVFAVALLPILGGGASQMFDAETSGITHERFRPRITQVAKRLWGLYLVLTAVLAGLLWLGPMDLFDAINHSFTCISTGGYSTKNAGVAFWDSPYIEYIIAIFMCIGSTNMTLLYFLFNGKIGKLWRDEETRWFYSIVALSTLITFVWIYGKGMVAELEPAFRASFFQVVNLLSTSGYTYVDYLQWGPFFWLFSMLLMVICGCTGSTSGGLKVGRVLILSKNLLNEFKKQTHPKAVLPVRMNGRVVSSEIVHRILAFVFIYICLLLLCCFLLTIDGMGFEEALGSSVSAVANAGPGLGSVGPIYNYAAVPDLSKWVLSFAMMIGRLEIFTVLTILLPGFWKQ